MNEIAVDQYIEERVNGQLEWLSSASRSNKQQFFRLRILEILLGTSITILSPFARSLDWVPLLLALAGGGVAVSSSVLALNRNQENWIRYRSLTEHLKREKYLFLTGASPYDKEAEPYKAFVRIAEDLMLAERVAWTKQQPDQAEKNSSPEPRSAPGA